MEALEARLPWTVFGGLDFNIDACTDWNALGDFFFKEGSLIPRDTYFSHLR